MCISLRHRNRSLKSLSFFLVKFTNIIIYNQFWSYANVLQLYLITLLQNGIENCIDHLSKNLHNIIAYLYIYTRSM